MTHFKSVTNARLQPINEFVEHAEEIKRMRKV